MLAAFDEGQGGQFPDDFAVGAWLEVKVEGLEGVRGREAGLAHARLGAAHPARLPLGLEGRCQKGSVVEILLGRLFGETGHDGTLKPGNNVTERHE